ncbi:hypothetical protein Kuja_0090 [Vibrio phage vB_VchM_Kuja]|uniref:Uncharacterized protein n=1 Tax=Vibrio phage vB_VchM_Kuja TaxID=2686437 RepID=A0A6B9J511_9CAUD|nr:hypothetical protein HWC83_gp009 [Vibrio phage vB_VchM_Kuja]QGZ16000.1 hypothetical protein Kuja_0090 [Vibrio phage vB_VchM_Kuja]
MTMSTEYFKKIEQNNANEFISIANKVGMLNNMFGNQRVYLSDMDYSDPDQINIDMMKPVWKQRKLIVEETEEIVKAFEKLDHKNILDGIGDFITVYYGEHYINAETDATVYTVPTALLNQDGPVDDWCAMLKIANNRLKRFIEVNEKYVPDSGVLFDCEASLNRLFRIFLGFTEEYLKKYYIHAISIEEIYDCVHKSNMTKFFKPEQQQQTVQFYEDKGYPIEKLGVTNVANGLLKIYVTKSFDMGDKHFPEGKFLKGIGFTEPDFEGVLALLKSINN